MTVEGKKSLNPSKVLEECRVTYFLSSGPGGQHRDRKRTAVRLEHLPTGIVTVSKKRRSRAMNLREALERLVEKIGERQKVKKHRVPTRVPKKVREAIREEKRRRTLKKKERRKVDRDY
jgi:protein subunit release factor B